MQDARKIRLLEWLTTPESAREPSSQRQIAEELGVSARTIRDWKANPAFRATWEKQAKDIIGDPGKVQEVLEAMRVLALDVTSPKQTKAAEIYLKAVDGIKPPAIDLAAKKAAEMTDAELDAMIAEGAQRLAEARRG